MILHPAINDIYNRREAIDKSIATGRIDLPTAIGRYSWVNKDGQSLGMSHVGGADPNSANTSDHSIPWTISTQQEDRDGDICVSMGIQLGDYALNPVILFGHGDWSLPIAKSMSPDGRLCVYPEENRVRATAFFDDHDEDAMRVYDKILRGFISAASVAFVPIEAYRRDDIEKAHSGSGGQTPKGWLFKIWNLTEWSTVVTPSNAGAIRDDLDTDKSGSPRLRKALGAYAAKSTNERGGGCWSGWCPTPTGCKPCEKGTPMTTKKSAASNRSGKGLRSMLVEKSIKALTTQGDPAMGSIRVYDGPEQVGSISQMGKTKWRAELNGRVVANAAGNWRLGLVAIEQAYNKSSAKSPSHRKANELPRNVQKTMLSFPDDKTLQQFWREASKVEREDSADGISKRPGETSVWVGGSTDFVSQVMQIAAKYGIKSFRKANELPPRDRDWGTDFPTLALNLTPSDKQRMEQACPTELAAWRRAGEAHYDIPTANGRTENRRRYEQALDALRAAWQRAGKSLMGSNRGGTGNYLDKMSFKVGDKVKDSYGGGGTVEEVRGSGRNAEYIVAMDDGSTQRFNRSDLEKKSLTKSSSCKCGGSCGRCKALGEGSAAAGGYTVPDAFGEECPFCGMVECNGECDVAKKKGIFGGSTVNDKTGKPIKVGDTVTVPFAGVPTRHTVDRISGQNLTLTNDNDGTSGWNIAANQATLLVKSMACKPTKKQAPAKRRKAAEPPVEEEALEPNDQETKEEDAPVKPSAMVAAKSYNHLKELGEYLGEARKTIDHPGMDKAFGEATDDVIPKAMQHFKDAVAEHHPDTDFEKACQKALEGTTDLPTGEANLVDRGETPEKDFGDETVENDFEEVEDKGIENKELMECPTCGGTGRSTTGRGGVCPECDGEGFVNKGLEDDGVHEKIDGSDCEGADNDDPECRAMFANVGKDIEDDEEDPDLDEILERYQQPKQFRQKSTGRLFKRLAWATRKAGPARVAAVLLDGGRIRTDGEGRKWLVAGVTKNLAGSGGKPFYRDWDGKWSVSVGGQAIEAGPFNSESEAISWIQKNKPLRRKDFTEEPPVPTEMAMKDEHREAVSKAAKALDGMTAAHDMPEHHQAGLETHAEKLKALGEGSGDPAEVIGKAQRHMKALADAPDMPEHHKDALDHHAGELAKCMKDLEGDADHEPTDEEKSVHKDFKIGDGVRNNRNLTTGVVVSVGNNTITVESDSSHSPVSWPKSEVTVVNSKSVRKAEEEAEETAKDLTSEDDDLHGGAGGEGAGPNLTNEGNPAEMKDDEPEQLKSDPKYAIQNKGGRFWDGERFTTRDKGLWFRTEAAASREARTAKGTDRTARVVKAAMRKALFNVGDEVYVGDEESGRMDKITGVSTQGPNQVLTVRAGHTFVVGSGGRIVGPSGSRFLGDIVQQAKSKSVSPAVAQEFAAFRKEGRDLDRRLNQMLAPVLNGSKVR